MSFDQKALWVFVFLFLICGFGLLTAGNAMLPERVYPANELVTWLLPGSLTMISGLIGLGGALAALVLLNRK